MLFDFIKKSFFTLLQLFPICQYFPLTGQEEVVNSQALKL
jgi:hypothetical protein